MKTLLTYVPDYFVNALGWTIFHSLWQGLAIGIILLLIFKSRRNISSQAGYLLGVFALAAIFILSVFTFFTAYHPLPSTADYVSHSSESISNLAGLSEAAGRLSLLDPDPSGWKQSLISTFDFVSILWFIGVLILATRLAGGMLVINGLRRQQVSPLPSGWEQRLQKLAVKTGLRRSITYLQSQKVRVPVLIGMLRPVVLIPAMIISGLPADQLETIIVHELAHIRRHDFLINILQSIMEALFFYHPVVWIISENIRQEREKCCDDYTVRVCGQVSLYARALAGLSELQITAAVPCLAINGNKKNILHRVERLINHKKMKNNMTERLVAGLVLMTSVLIITLSTGATFMPSGFVQMKSQVELPYFDKKAAVPVTDPEPVAEPAAASEPTAITETAAVSPAAAPAAAAAAANISLPAPVSEPAGILQPAPAVPVDTSYRHDRDHMDIKDNTVTREFLNKDGEDHEMKFLIRQGAVTELYVDGRRIPDNEFFKYQKEIDVTVEDLQDMERDLKHAREELAHVDFDKIRKEIQIEMQHFKEYEMQGLQEELQKLQEEQFRNQLDDKALREEIENAMRDVQIDQEKIQEEMFKAQEEIKRAIEDFEQGKYKLNEEEFKQAIKEMELGMAELKKEMAILETEDIQKMMDEAVKSVQEIDYEGMQREIEKAMKEIKEIDFAEIEKEIQSAMIDIEKDKIDLDKEKKNIDEMIEELEKLELDEN
jgi:bla regulator protein BlaR1